MLSAVLLDLLASTRHSQTSMPQSCLIIISSFSSAPCVRHVQKQQQKPGDGVAITGLQPRRSEHVRFDWRAYTIAGARSIRVIVCCSLQGTIIHRWWSESSLEQKELNPPSYVSKNLIISFLMANSTTLFNVMFDYGRQWNTHSKRCREPRISDLGT